jgi:hypothetical protein
VAAHASRQSFNSSVEFQSRFFFPNPPPHLAHRQHDMRVRLGLPSFALSQCTLRSRPCRDRQTPSARNRGERDALLLVHLARIENSTSRAKLRVLALLPASTSFHKVVRSFKRSGAPSGNITSEWTRRPCC